MKEEWTECANEAQRFDTKEHAEHEADRLFSRFPGDSKRLCTVTEHVFLDRAAPSATGRTSDQEALLLTGVLNQARETLLVSIKGTPEDLQRSLGKLNLACKAHWDWRTEKIRAADGRDHG